MLYNTVTNDWGEVTYVPTTLGNVLLAILIVLLLLAAMFCTPACFLRCSGCARNSAFQHQAVSFSNWRLYHSALDAGYLSARLLVRSRCRSDERRCLWHTSAFN